MRREYLAMIGTVLILSAIIDRFLMGDLLTTFWLLPYYGGVWVGLAFIIVSRLAKEERERK